VPRCVLGWLRRQGGVPVALKNKEECNYMNKATNFKGKQRKMSKQEFYQHMADSGDVYYKILLAFIKGVKK